MKVYIRTWGCAANKAESQIMAGLLSRAGFTIVSSPEIADIIIYNTCGVKETTKNKVLFEIQKGCKAYKSKIVITGCLPEIDLNSVSETCPRASIISTNYITKIVTYMRKILKGEKVEVLGKAKLEKVAIPKIRENKVIDIIPICSGCLSACTYCATRLAKGSLFSYSPSKIIREMKEAKQVGVKEFWLTGQDVSAFGYDFDYKYRLPDLLRDILDEIRGKYFIRIGMLNPRHLKDYTDELVEIYEDKRVFKFLHIPVQSGSDKVLKKMARGYKVDDFIEIVSSFRKKIPDITIWTDIIVGFPEESEKDFEETKKLIKDIKPDWVNVSRFSSHPGTLAHKMKQINTETKKRRSKELSEIVDKIAEERNEKWIEWTGEVLVDEFNREKRSFIGRNYAYKPIVLKGRYKLGEFVKVKIIDAKKTHLVGVPL